jgi:hypothetical protein
LTKKTEDKGQQPKTRNKYQILVLEFNGYALTKTGKLRPFYDKIRGLTFTSDKTIGEVKAELETIVFHTYHVMVKEILGTIHDKKGRSRPKMGKTRSFTLKTNSDIDELKLEIGRKLEIPVRKSGRPRKKKPASENT